VKWLKVKWTGFSEWAAWSAWNYSRKRAIRRQKWLPEDAKDAKRDDTPDQRRINGKQLLHGLRREFLRKLDDGYMAEVELVELERQRRPLRMTR
jgi:hypothetical protein